MPESYVDVLVCGAGPAGLMCANALAKAGVNVRIIDQRPIRVAAGQADGIQPRTIEILQSYGLAQRLLAEGNQIHMAAFYNPSADGGIELTERVLDVTAPSARFPFEVTLHQGAIESIFLDSLSSMGTQVDRPIIPTSISISDDLVGDPQAHAVTVKLKHLELEQSEIVHAKFVVGCDGAHSWIRKSLGIVMEGEQTDYVWGVVDMLPDTNFPDIRNRCVIHSDNGSCMVIPREEDKVRLYIQLEGKDAIDATKGRVDKSRFGPDQIFEVARKSLQPYTFRQPKEYEWWTIYIIGQRVASQYSVHDRVFIAGDACHTHSPKAGQGMNASMSDTHNLAWKLTHVLRGWADIHLLKTYESERRQYAQDLINFDKKFAKLFSGKPRTEINQNGVSHEEFLQIFQTFGGFTCGIDVHYAPSSIVDPGHQSCARNLIVGRRMPPQILIRAADGHPYELQDLLPSDSRFKLLVFTGDMTETEQLRKVYGLAEKLTSSNGLLQRFPDSSKFCDIISISVAKKTNVRYTDLPEVLRPRWSKVFIDDTDATGRQGGKAYSSFGIDPQGAIVIVRPDGYVGMVAPLNGVEAIEDYFTKFTKVANRH